MKSTYNAYRVKTPNPDLAVTLDQVRTHLKLDEIASEDDYVEGLIRASVLNVERVYGMGLLTQTIEQYHRAFPANAECPMLFRINPLREVVSVKYLDTDGVEQTWDSAEYESGQIGKDYYLLPKYGYDWPDCLQNRPNSVTIEYTVGYGDSPSSVPKDIAQAIMMAVGDRERNREDRVDTLPKASEALLLPYYRFSA